MARVIFSPLISSMSGKTADAVFATWKGRPYVRERVIPANPQTAAQTAVRNSLAELVAMWHIMDADLQTAYGLGAANLAISGYNDWVGRNRAQMQAATGLYGPRRNPEADDPYMTIPTDMTFGPAGAGRIHSLWTSVGSPDVVGIMVYDTVTNVFETQNLNLVPEAGGEFTTAADYTSGNLCILAAFLHRLADDEIVHIAHGAVTPA